MANITLNQGNLALKVNVQKTEREDVKCECPVFNETDLYSNSRSAGACISDKTTYCKWDNGRAVH